MLFLLFLLVCVSVTVTSISHPSSVSHHGLLNNLIQTIVLSPSTDRTQKCSQYSSTAGAELEEPLPLSTRCMPAKSATLRLCGLCVIAVRFWILQLYIVLDLAAAASSRRPRVYSAFSREIHRNPHHQKCAATNNTPAIVTAIVD